VRSHARRLRTDRKRLSLRGGSIWINDEPNRCRLSLLHHVSRAQVDARHRGDRRKCKLAQGASPLCGACAGVWLERLTKWFVFSSDPPGRLHHQTARCTHWSDGTESLALGRASKRSRHMRLLPDHRPRKRCSCDRLLDRVTQAIASAPAQRKSVPFIHIL
jgi:hypothetical protein